MKFGGMCTELKNKIGYPKVEPSKYGNLIYSRLAFQIKKKNIYIKKYCLKTLLTI